MTAGEDTIVQQRVLCGAFAPLSAAALSSTTPAPRATPPPSAKVPEGASNTMMDEALAKPNRTTIAASPASETSAPFPLTLGLSLPLPLTPDAHRADIHDDLASPATVLQSLSATTPMALSPPAAAGTGMSQCNNNASYFNAMPAPSCDLFNLGVPISPLSPSLGAPTAAITPRSVADAYVPLASQPLIGDSFLPQSFVPNMTNGTVQSTAAFLNSELATGSVHNVDGATEAQISLVPQPLTLPTSFAMACRDATPEGNEGDDEDGDGEDDDAGAFMVPAELTAAWLSSLTTPSGSFPQTVAQGMYAPTHTDTLLHAHGPTATATLPGLDVFHPAHATPPSASATASAPFGSNDAPMSAAFVAQLQTLMQTFGMPAAPVASTAFAPPHPYPYPIPPSHVSLSMHDATGTPPRRRRRRRTAIASTIASGEVLAASRDDDGGASAGTARVKSCHICARAFSPPGSGVYCTSVERRRCKKAVCASCIAKHDWDRTDVLDAAGRRASFICPHCRGSCSKLPWARCFRYHGRRKRMPAAGMPGAPSSNAA